MLSEEDAQIICSKATEMDKADALYSIALTKIDGYDELIKASKETKQTGALKILLDGKENQQKLDGENLVQILKTQRPPPEDPKYYVKRMLSRKTKLDPAVFHNSFTSDSIFVFTGITKYELSKIAAKEPTDESEILKIAQKPVHLVKFENNSFTWLKSSQMVTRIACFVTSEAEYCAEEDLVDQIVTPNYPFQNSFIISDSPGMGKTFLAACLARRVEFFENIVLFYVFHEFVQNWTTIDSTDAALKKIASHAVKDDSKKLTDELMKIFSSEKFHLFLDGYDEIVYEKGDVVDAFLLHASKLENFTIIVTTRPHVGYNLCSAFHVLPYEILPFRLNDQISFLTKYWIEKYQVKESEDLTKFAESCLNDLKEKMTDEENEIAGIPLQCLMLAEVYAKDAKRSSSIETHSEFQPRIHGIFDMYRELVTLKFKRLSKDKTGSLSDETIFKDFKKSYTHFHYYKSIKLLFPDWIEKFDKHLKRRKDVNKEIVHSIGILEKRGETEKSRFIHRTFAEYLLADFFVRHLTKSRDCMDLVFDVIFACSIIQTRDSFGTMSSTEPTQNTTPKMYQVAYPNIAYFIEHHLKTYLKNNFIDHKIIQLHFNAKQLKLEKFENISMIPAACCCSNLEHCFDLITNIVFELELKELNSLNTNHFNHLPHLAVMHSRNKSFIEKVMNLKRYRIIKENPNFDFFHPPSNPQIEDIDHCNYPWLPNCSPLHLAVHQGNFEITKFLLQAYKDKVSEMKYLIHVCVQNSAKNSEIIISDKVEIIKLLHDYNNNWLEEVFQDSSCPPILQKNVHIKLLQTLVELGANINAYSKIYGTLLHRSVSVEIIRWASSSGFKLINKSPDSEYDMQYSPLLHAINYYGQQLNEELIDEFVAAGTDINGQDRSGNSVLFHAVQYASAEVVNKILKHGANVNHRSNHGKSAMNAALDRKCSADENKSELVKILKLLVSHGFKGINETYGNETPLLKIIRHSPYKPVDEDVLHFLYENGADFNVRNTEGYSVLHFAITNKCTTGVLEKIIKFGADINNKDNKVLEALHELVDTGMNTIYYSTDREYEERILVLEIITTILSKKFNQINDPVKYGRSLLFKTAQLKYLNPELLDLFHANTADFTVIHPFEGSLLFIAIEKGQGKDVINTIIKYGSSLRYKNCLGKTASHIAVKFANLSALEYLQPFFDVNVMDNMGNTPLHLLFANLGIIHDDHNLKANEQANRRRILELLLQHGANLKAKNSSKKMPLTNWVTCDGLWNDMFQNFLELKDILKIDEQIATNCLAAVIWNTDSFYLNPMGDNDSFIEFFHLLVDKGGKIQILENTPFQWKFLLLENLWTLLTDVELTYGFLQYLKNISSMNIPMNARHLWFLICSCNQVTIEHILSGLLACKEFNFFYKLCEILYFTRMALVRRIYANYYTYNLHTRSSS